MRRLLIIALLAASAVLVLGATATAGVTTCDPTAYPPCDPTSVIVDPVSQVGGVSAVSSNVAGTRASLPYTGSNSSVPWAAIGGGILLLGVALTITGYRRHTAHLDA